jgi:hypothetical protein
MGVAGSADTAIHYLVAREIFFPLIENYQNGIDLFRFHRLYVPAFVFKGTEKIYGKIRF